MLDKILSIIQSVSLMVVLVLRGKLGRVKEEKEALTETLKTRAVVRDKEKQLEESRRHERVKSREELESQSEQRAGGDRPAVFGDRRLHDR